MAETKDKKLKQLDTLIETSALINSILDSSEIEKRAIESAARLLDAEAGSLILIDRKAGELFFEVATGSKGDKVRKIRLKMGQGIAGWVVEKEKALIVHDVARDSRFFSEADRRTKFKTKNILCVPVRTKDKIIGVLEVVNKKQGRFNRDDTMILSALANQVAIAIENSRLYSEAITDSLTGLYHHGYFELRLKEELEKARRYAYPLSLLMIDIDFFKKINDEFGHPAGDKVLKELAVLLSNSLRLGDVVARYGGEEFAIILPHADRKNAVMVGERLRTKTQEMAVDGVRLTISVGVGFFHGKKEIGYKELVKQADDALYTAKKNGRNRVEII